MSRTPSDSNRRMICEFAMDRAGVELWNANSWIRPLLRGNPRQSADDCGGLAVHGADIDADPPALRLRRGATVESEPQNGPSTTCPGVVKALISVINGSTGFCGCAGCRVGELEKVGDGCGGGIAVLLSRADGLTMLIAKETRRDAHRFRKTIWPTIEKPLRATLS